MSAKFQSRRSFSLGTLLLSVLYCAAPGAAQAERVTGSGASRTEQRNVAGIRGIALEVAADVLLRQGDKEGVALTGDDNIVPLVATVVENGTLKIRWAKPRLDASYRNLAIVVDVRTLEALAVGGAGSFHAERIATDMLKVTIGGSGDVAVNALDGKSVRVTLAGSGAVRLAGRADSLEATIAGSGELAAGKLEARDVRVAMQGSGKATVWATANLDATIAGSGAVVYLGNPKVNSTIAGSGDIRPATGAP